MFVLPARRNGGSLLAFGPDGRTLAARSDTGLQLWRGIAPGAKPTVFRNLYEVGFMGFSPDGHRLYLDGHVGGVLDVRTGEYRPFPPAHGYRYYRPSPDGRVLYAVHLPPSGRNQVACWSADAPFAGKPVWRVPLRRPFGGRPLPLPGGRFVVDEGVGAAGSRLYCYVIRSGETGAVEAETESSDWFSERDAVSPDGRWLACQHTNRVRVWSLDNLSAPPVGWDSGSRKIFTDLAFHPAGRLLAVAGTDGLVRFHAVGSWEVVRAFEWKLGKMVGVAFSPDGTLAAAGSDTGKIVVWDVDG